MLTERNTTFRKPWSMIILFIGPVMIYYCLFIIYPIIATIVISFTRTVPKEGRLTTVWVGLENFKALLTDPIARKAAGNTLIWGAVGPALEMLTALILAFVVYYRIPLFRLYRFFWFTPVLITGVIVGLVFRWVFNYEWGLLNTFLRFIGLSKLALNWLGRLDTPLWAVILVHYWNTFGRSFILILGGLSTVNQDVLDSAAIDGANRWTIGVRILIPLILPVIVTVATLSFLGKMRAFHVVWVLTNGGPMHASETVATYVQKRAFGWSSVDLGYPSAIAVAWFVVVFLAVVLTSRRFQSRINY